MRTASPTSRSTRQPSVARRLMLGTGLLALACFGFTAVISYWRSSDALLDSAQARLQDLAGQEAQRIAAEIAVAADTGTALANSFSVQRSLGSLDRTAANEIIRAQLQAHPQWLGMGTLWEPDAFDGKDAAFVDSEGHDGSGRFMTWWAWQDGTLVREALRDYEKPGDGDWNLKPRQTLAQAVVEPYYYPVAGKDTLMTTVATPILEDGRYQGVITVDFTLAALQARIAAMRPMEVGHATLLSPAGSVMASRNADEVGKLRDDAGTQAMLAAVAKGETIGSQARFNGEEELQVFVPLRVGSAPQVFALGIAVPKAHVMAQARTLLWVIVAVGLFSAVLLSAALFVLLRALVLKPLAEAERVSAAVAEGRLDSRISVSRNDEVGRLLTSMGAMQDQLRAVIAAQADMAGRHDEGQMRYRLDDRAFPGEYGRMVAGTNMLVAGHVDVQRRLVEVMACYAVGDMSADMEELPGEKAMISAAMRDTKANLQAINAQILQLAHAAAAGDFTQRGDATRFTHDFRSMVEGLNTLMHTTDGNLAELSRLLQAIARGDLTARMQGDFHGVFARMRRDADTTVEQLTRIVGGIQQASAMINSAAGEIAAGNEDLSQRTEQQAASLEETAASMEELTSTVRQNADHARQANQLVQGTATVASQGGEVVAQVVQTMTGIEGSSRRIAEIITVIDGIAFQTNILALNAAVEAARAGEQGRGFAVVATEVRALAQRSATAAREIKGLIDDSVGQVEQGAQLVRQAGSTMQDIVTSVHRVTDIMAEISAASQEQSAGIEQVSQTVVQMDEATQQNAALVEEANAAARSLEEQSHELQQAVAIFRLRETSTLTPRAALTAEPA
ncbi:MULTISPECIES: methyl-accepting chemotaxis protein [unclassified Stenotrophomonas]|uniref:methyl-accepting chemotaxis protein n=1 Tax=unclassified Stenotrophomonas TaxID=196198 RepID=UPI0022B7E6B1|nr:MULTISPECIES: methyl-accepting chemotaxis protein [unclassified Stenotrophomonas]